MHNLETKCALLNVITNSSTIIYHYQQHTQAEKDPWVRLAGVCGGHNTRNTR